MPAITYRDERRHRIRLEVPCEGTPDLLENVYEHLTRRVYYLWGVPVWWNEIDVERRPMHEFIRRAVGG